MRRNVLRTAKHVYHVDMVSNVGEFSINCFAENLCDIGIVNGHRNNFVPGILHVLRNVERRLTGLKFSLDAEDGNRFCLRKKIADLIAARENIVAPIVSHQPQINADGRPRQIGRGLTRIHADARAIRTIVMALFSLVSYSGYLRESAASHLQKFTPTAAMTASTTATIASPQI